MAVLVASPEVAPQNLVLRKCLSLQNLRGSLGSCFQLKLIGEMISEAATGFDVELEVLKICIQHVPTAVIVLLPYLNEPRALFAD